MRRAMVVAASPFARSEATYAASLSVSASVGDVPSHAQRSARSRRYASTVRGASRVVDSARNDSTASGARVGTVVHLSQSPGVDVCIHLRRRQGGVSEQLLDRAQVGTALEQMRREGMAQAMRVRREPAQRARVEPLTARGDEERVVRAVGKRRSRLVHVARDPVRRLFAERHDPLLATLAAAYVHELLLE